MRRRQVGLGACTESRRYPLVSRWAGDESFQRLATGRPRDLLDGPAEHQPWQFYIFLHWTLGDQPPHRVTQGEKSPLFGTDLGGDPKSDSISGESEEHP
jgi:hypothetical protein